MFESTVVVCIDGDLRAPPIVKPRGPSSPFESNPNLGFRDRTSNRSDPYPVGRMLGRSYGSLRIFESAFAGLEA